MVVGAPNTIAPIADVTARLSLGGRAFRVLSVLQRMIDMMVGIWAA
jgi:hypothetical protein